MMSINGIGSTSSSLYQSLLAAYKQQSAQSSAYAQQDSTDDTRKSGATASTDNVSKQQDLQALLKQMQLSSPSLLDFMSGDASDSDDAGSENDLSSLFGTDETSSLTGGSSLDSSQSALEAMLNGGSDTANGNTESNDPFALLLSSLGVRMNNADRGTLLDQLFSKTNAYEDGGEQVPGQTVNRVQ